MSSLRPYAKSIVPFAGTIAAVLIQWLATGEFDRSELATALTGLLAALVAYAAPNAEPDPGNLDLPADREPVSAHTGLVD